MPDIFVNLKRFEVPRRFGGLCPLDDPIAWIQSVMEDSVRMGLGCYPNLDLTYLLPEGLLAPTIHKLKDFSDEEISSLHVGCQSVHWEDISPEGNFGAFTSSLPASAARSLGCSWSIIGHSEERKAVHQVLNTFEPSIEHDNSLRSKALRTVDTLINAEVKHALNVDLNVLLCVGETAEERGDGEFDEQKPRIESSLESQLLNGIHDVPQILGNKRFVIGYEPIWAIGPGKVPPGKEYIQFVASYIKKVVNENFGFDPVVVYGGGLKEENANMISSIDIISGGLVALTRFSGEIGFRVEELKGIIDRYMSH